MIATMLVAFFMCFYSYRQGLKDGLAIKKDEPIKETPIKETITNIFKPKEAVEVDEIARGWENLMSYDGTPQKGDDDK